MLKATGRKKPAGEIESAEVNSGGGKEGHNMI